MAGMQMKFCVTLSGVTLSGGVGADEAIDSLGHRPFFFRCCRGWGEAKKKP